MIEVVELADIEVDALNPRKRDEGRLLALMGSLSRFGHVLPVVVSDDGLIVSGHQRSEAARRLGATRVPVLRTKVLSELERANRLLLLNLATNDSQGRLNLRQLGADLDLPALTARLGALPEVDVDDPGAWPCMNVDEWSVRDLARMNPDVKEGEDGFEGAWTLSRGRYKLRLPIVVDRHGRIVSGRLRFSAALWGHADTWPVVQVPLEDTELVGACLNDLSMGYDVAGYEDTLRSSVWLTHLWNRRHLGQGFIHWTSPGLSSVKFNILEPETAARFREVHGHYLADIGAGHMNETGLLNKAGFRCVAFEPYLLDGSATPSLEASRRMVQVFLDEIARGQQFDSVFLSSVLNQVPFEVDRFRVLTLVHALCGAGTAAYISTMHRGESSWRQYTAGRQRPVFRSGYRNVDLLIEGPEPGTYISSMASGRAMVQKFHTPEELAHLTGQLWGSVDLVKASKHLHVKATDPKPLNVAWVRKMIDHEFNLPWPGGERLGMVEQATVAFEKRLGVSLR
jgi:hypothetical protein